MPLVIHICDPPTPSGLCRPVASVPSVAVKTRNASPLSAETHRVKKEGVASGAPGRMSTSRAVVAAVPPDTHSSAPWAQSSAWK